VTEKIWTDIWKRSLRQALSDVYDPDWFELSLCRPNQVKQLEWFFSYFLHDLHNRDLVYYTWLRLSEFDLTSEMLLSRTFYVVYMIWCNCLSLCDRENLKRHTKSFPLELFVFVASLLFIYQMTLIGEIEIDIWTCFRLNSLYHLCYVQ
jgi:hypothetical protein